jgi:hypothetical protein
LPSRWPVPPSISRRGCWPSFARTQADVRIRLLIDNRDTVSRLLAGNEVDLAIMGRPPAELDAWRWPLRRTRW